MNDEKNNQTIYAEIEEIACHQHLPEWAALVFIHLFKRINELEKEIKEITK